MVQECSCCPCLCCRSSKKGKTRRTPPNRNPVLYYICFKSEEVWESQSSSSGSSRQSSSDDSGPQQLTRSFQHPEFWYVTPDLSSPKHVRFADLPVRATCYRLGFTSRTFIHVHALVHTFYSCPSLFLGFFLGSHSVNICTFSVNNFIITCDLVHVKQSTQLL